MAYGNEAVSSTQIKEWHYHFKDGQISVESNKCSSRLSTSKHPETFDKMWGLVVEDHQIMIREIVCEFEISLGSVQPILTDDLKMHVSQENAL